MPISFTKDVEGEREKYRRGDRGARSFWPYPELSKKKDMLPNPEKYLRGGVPDEQAKDRVCNRRRGGAVSKAWGY